MKWQITLLTMMMFIVVAQGYEVNTPTSLSFQCTINNALPSDSATFNITIKHLESGVILVNNQNTTPEGNGAFSYPIVFNEAGDYTVFQVCTDGSLNYSSQEIIRVGAPDPDGPLILGFSVIFLLIIGGIAYILIKSIGLGISREFDILDLAYNYGLFFALFAFYYLASYYLDNVVINDMLWLFVRVMGIPLLFLPVVYFVMSIASNITATKQQNKQWGYRT